MSAPSYEIQATQIQAVETVNIEFGRPADLSLQPDNKEIEVALPLQASQIDLVRQNPSLLVDGFVEEALIYERTATPDPSRTRLLGTVPGGDGSREFVAIQLPEPPRPAGMFMRGIAALMGKDLDNPRVYAMVENIDPVLPKQHQFRLFE